jgi:hypothetical protein
MAVLGSGITADNLNARMCALAQRRHKQAVDAAAFAKFIDGLDIAGLELAGFSSAEATSFKASVDVLKSDAYIWQGLATQPGAYDFSNSLAAYIGPDPEA